MTHNTTESYTSGLTEYVLDDLLTEASKIKKVVAIYPGRFQPAGVHHAKTYKWLQKKFKDAWVVTSNKVDGVKSPLNFKEKKLVWNKHGVKKVKQVKNPYAPEELLKKYDPETTAVVFIYGEKDPDRLKTTKADGSLGYYQHYEENKKNLKGYTEHGYVIVAPHVSIKVLGKEVSGTHAREVLGSPEYDKMTKVRAFEDLFGWFDEEIFGKLTKKFSTLFENEEIYEAFLEEYPKFEKLVNSFPTILSEITTVGGMGKSMVDDGPAGYYPGTSYEIHTNKRAQHLGYDVLDFIVGKNGEGRNTDYREWGQYAGPVPAVSFFAAGDAGKKSPTNQVDIDNTRHAHKEWTKFVEGVAETAGYKIVDFLGTNKAIRRRIERGTEELSGTHTLSAKAHMTTNEPGKDEIEAGPEGHEVKESVKSILDSYIELLTEGGAAGHMSHPFDDRDLTFADLKEMIRRVLAGELSVEKEVTEKLDGQNLMFSWKDGKLISARNKGHLKNAGAAAPDVAGIAQMFSEKPENIRDAFVSAVEDLESAISKLSDAQKNKVFREGERFMNIEVMTPATQNVIPQDVDMLVFHGTQAYNSAGLPVSVDEDGNDITSELKDSAKRLEGMLSQINANVQSRYSLNAPIVVSLPKSKTFDSSLEKYITMIDKLKKEFKLKDNDKVMKYHVAWWNNLLDKQQSKFKEVFPANVYTSLMGRWAYNDKSNKINTIRMDLSGQPKLLAWVNKFEKEDIVKQFEENMWPFQYIFLQLGAEVLQNVKGFVAAGGADDITKALEDHIKTLEKKKIGSAESPEKFKRDMAKLYKNLKRLDDIGGTDVIAPSEGIVFQFKGGTYKLTGTFAPINQIMGIMRF